MLMFLPRSGKLILARRFNARLNSGRATWRRNGLWTTLSSLPSWGITSCLIARFVQSLQYDEASSPSYHSITNHQFPIPDVFVLHESRTSKLCIAQKERPQRWTAACWV